MGMARTFFFPFRSCSLGAKRDWQGVNPKTGRLEITTTANQDPLLTHVPVIGVDIWEHAFYLQYLNVKADVSYLGYVCGEFGVLIANEYLVPRCYLERHQLRGG